MGNAKKAAFLPRFFKTGKGEYGEGDKFLGVTVPQMRTIAKEHRSASFDDITKLLEDPYHEVRLTALLILVDQYERGDAKVRKKVVAFYLKNLRFINNWDLVDLTAPKILGHHLREAKKETMLEKFAKSKNFWEQRMAIVATYAFIREGNTQPTMIIATMLLHHSHDLIHKAVGWMLREAGKRNEKALEAYLDKHAATMPRTTLRYAIEKFSEQKRCKYLRMKRG